MSRKQPAPPNPVTKRVAEMRASKRALAVAYFKEDEKLLVDKVAWMILQRKPCVRLSVRVKLRCVDREEYLEVAAEYFRAYGYRVTYVSPSETRTLIHTEIRVYNPEAKWWWCFVKTHREV